MARQQSGCHYSKCTFCKENSKICSSKFLLESSLKRMDHSTLSYFLSMLLPSTSIVSCIKSVPCLQHIYPSNFFQKQLSLMVSEFNNFWMREGEKVHLICTSRNLKCLQNSKFLKSFYIGNWHNTPRVFSGKYCRLCRSLAIFL